MVDLFSGCGGLSLGVAESARRVGLATEFVLAADIDQDAVDVFRLNFPKANVQHEDVGVLFDGELGARATSKERRFRKEAGPADILLSGAPCQGHSDLNNHTRRRDPRNALYLRAVRAAEVLQPSFVLLENVPAVQHDAGRVIDVATEALIRAGYAVGRRVLHLAELGVPQVRRRHFLLASRRGLPDPSAVLDLTSPCFAHLPRSIRWAIGDLNGVRAKTDFDRAAKSTKESETRISWLFDHGEYNLPNHLRPPCHQGDHSYRSMYGRLGWDSPAQTITTGFGSMGQGRYVHPSRRRTITPHEAARLQTFPDFFDFDLLKSRRSWAKMIGNAVPPLIGLQLASRLLSSVPDPKEARSVSGPKVPDRRRVVA